MCFINYRIHKFDNFVLFCLLCPCWILHFDLIFLNTGIWPETFLYRGLSILWYNCCGLWLLCSMSVSHFHWGVNLKACSFSFSCQDCSIVVSWSCVLTCFLILGNIPAWILIYYIEPLFWYITGILSLNLLLMFLVWADFIKTTSWKSLSLYREAMNEMWDLAISVLCRTLWIYLWIFFGFHCGSTKSSRVKHFFPLDNEIRAVQRKYKGMER